MTCWSTKDFEVDDLLLHRFSVIRWSFSFSLINERTGPNRDPLATWNNYRGSLDVTYPLQIVNNRYRVVLNHD